MLMVLTSDYNDRDDGDDHHDDHGDDDDDDHDDDDDADADANADTDADADEEDQEEEGGGGGGSCTSVVQSISFAPFNPPSPSFPEEMPGPSELPAPCSLHRETHRRPCRRRQREASGWSSFFMSVIPSLLYSSLQTFTHEGLANLYKSCYVC